MKQARSLASHSRSYKQTHIIKQNHNRRYDMDMITRGAMVPQGNLMRINNAFVEEVSCFNNNWGSILVSYSVPERNFSIETIRLNINRGTIVLNSFGQRMCICCIQRGMWVNVIFSSRMTMSIPPQSVAISVVVQRTPQRPPFPQPPQPPRPPFPQPPQPPLPPLPPLPPPQSSVTTGRIVSIDFNNRVIVTENPNNRGDQTRFILTEATTFTNRFGIPISFDNLRRGQVVTITHANFQTPSFPPQTTAFNVQLL